MSLRVAFVVGHQRRGGIARYTDELATHLAGHDGVTVVPVGSEQRVATLTASAAWSSWDGDWIENRARSQAGEAAWIRRRLGYHVGRHGIDIVHCTKHLIPAHCQVPTLLTVYDLTVLERPGDFSLAKRALLPMFYRRSLREATWLLSISQATYDKFARTMPQLASKVNVVSLAPSSLGTRPPQPVESLRGQSFALFVGDLSPRKNLPFLTDFWPIVHRNTGLQLVVVGPKGWRSEGSEQAIGSLARRGLGRWLGPVPDEELAWLYGHASVVCVPSFEEGFGLPVLEALASDRPVVASDDPALVETGAGRSRHVSLEEPQTWVEAVCEAAVESPRRFHLTRTWGDVAADTIAVYRRVHGASRVPEIRLKPLYRRWPRRILISGRTRKSMLREPLVK